MCSSYWNQCSFDVANPNGALHLVMLKQWSCDDGEYIVYNKNKHYNCFLSICKNDYIGNPLYKMCYSIINQL